jgi:23S rRNA (adenine2503-C2)-methyltransferase
MIELFNLTHKQLIEVVEQNGFKKFRGNQIFEWIYAKTEFDFEKMTNISKQNRKEMAKIFSITPLKTPQIFIAPDKTEKYRFELDDGNLIETVLIPDKKRNTLCISTQAGCALKCSFCRTGSLGFARNLTVKEIVYQVIFAQKHLKKRNEKVNNIVFMGMGEPLLNFENTIDAISLIHDTQGLDFSNRRITVSTAGIIDKIIPLGEKTDGVNLAVSLHAADDETRSKIMPVNKTNPLKNLLNVLAKYPAHKRKRIVLEYILLKDINMREKDAKNLVKIAKKLNAKINLIPFNPFPGTIFEPASQEEMLAFQKLLIDRHATALMRKSRGGEKLAACGQLGLIKSNKI